MRRSSRTSSCSGWRWSGSTNGLRALVAAGGLIAGAQGALPVAACDVPAAATVDATQVIQGTLSRCAGGAVRLPAGTYRSGPLFLASGTTFELLDGATLIATDAPADYLRPDGGLYALINAADASDITLTGSGTIDGNGAGWWARTRAAQSVGQTPEPRPRLVAFDRCTRARVAGITLQNSPSFHLVFRSCTTVVVQDVTITAPSDSPNTDGIDPMASHDVRIVDTTIDTGDDSIAIKSGSVDPADPDGGASDITIDGCTFRHGHGVSIGSETNGGVRGVHVTNSVFRETQNGIRIKTNRDVGGRITQLTFANLAMEGVQQPIAFASYYPSIPPAADDLPQPLTATTPNVSDVVVANLRATGAQRAGWILGLPEQPYQRIVLSDVTISATSGLLIRNASVAVANATVTVASGAPVLLETGGILAPLPLVK